MAVLEIAGLPAVGTVDLPRVGLATVSALVAVPRSDPPAFVPGQQVRLKLELDGRRLEYALTVTRVGPQQGQHLVLAVGGRGRMDTVLQPRYYLGPTAALVCRDVLVEAGEVPDLGRGLEVPLDRWVRERQQAWEALRAVMGVLGERYAWRSTADGSIWVGLEEPVEYGSERDYEGEDPQASRLVLELVPDLLPGMLLGQDGLVDRVVHRVGRELRTEVWLSPWTG